MAERRMISKSLIRSDAFLAMPMSAQHLYNHLLLEADDDGFVSNSLSVAKLLGCSGMDLELLMEKGYVFRFPSGIIVMLHWFQHNTIRKDRYHPSIHPEKHLVTKRSDGTYEIIKSVPDSGNHLATKWQPDGNQKTENFPGKSLNPRILTWSS